MTSSVALIRAYAKTGITLSMDDAIAQQPMYVSRGKGKGTGVNKRKNYNTMAIKRASTKAHSIAKRK